MKVVIVCDWLTNMGGAENVNEELSKAFDNAPLYTSVFNREKLSPYLSKAEIHASCLQGKKEKIEKHQKYFPLMPYGFHHMKVEDCDVVISSSSSCAKMVKIPKGAIHICYTHTPMRYAWVMEKDYVSTLSWWKRPLAHILLAYMRRQDLKANKHVDYFVANSKCVAGRIKKYYGREATVIYPNVDVSNFTLCTESEDYYVIAGRFVRYKRFDLAVQACSELGRKLIVIGSGEDEERIRKVAGPTVTFTGRLPSEEMVRTIQHSRAFFFPGEEDFGIAPVEAMACGKPVIAFGKGGALETVIDGETGVYFHEQTVEAVKEAILKFEGMTFDPAKIAEHAHSFANSVFVEKMKAFVEKCYVEKHS